jgi:hypothetical protein
MSATAPATDRIATLLADADRLAGSGHPLEAIDLLHAANRDAPDPSLECRLAALRHQAFEVLAPSSPFPDWPVPLPDVDPTGPPGIPSLAPADLTADRVRRAILTHGSLYVPGLFGPDLVETLRDGIDKVLALRAANAETPVKRHGSWLASLPLPRDQAESLARNWIAGDGGILACDSPHLLELLLTSYEDAGLREVLTGYLGERPILSANKGTLRRARLDGKTDWHQDGAFLGTRQGIRALNVWVTLTDCGVDAPGMDIVPKRFDAIQETGTGGAIFDWAVGPDTVATLATDAPVVRPRYRAGDAMLFDDMLLHRTALDPSMTHTRHAIESWFFARTDFPEGQVPLVW